MVNVKKYTTTALYSALLISTAAAPLMFMSATPAHAEKAAVEAAPEAPADKKAGKRAKVAAKRAAAKAAAKEDKKSVVSEAQIKALNDSINAAKAQNAALQQQARAIRKEIFQIISADKFDSNAYISKNAAAESLNAKMRANMSKAIAATLSKYSKKERQYFAKKLVPTAKTTTRPTRGKSKHPAAKTGEKE